MVKHIKKFYKKDGKLTDDEKSKAYGAAWKAYNKDVNEGSSLIKARTSKKKSTYRGASGDHRRDKEGNIDASFYKKKPAPQGEKSGERIPVLTRKGKENKSPRYGSQLHRLRPKSERGYRSEGLEEGKCDDCSCEGCGKNPCIECGENHHKLKKVTEGSEHTQWSASIMLPSKRRKFVVVSCPSRDRKDAIQIIKALYGTDDIKQLNRIGIRVEGVVDIVRKYYGKKKPKKHVYPAGASGGDAGKKAATVVRDKEHKKYVNFLPANK